MGATHWVVENIKEMDIYTGCFFLLVLPKSGYVPGLVVNPRKKVRVWDFKKGFEYSLI